MSLFEQITKIFKNHFEISKEDKIFFKEIVLDGINVELNILCHYNE